MAENENETEKESSDALFDLPETDKCSTTEECSSGCQNDTANVKINRCQYPQRYNNNFENAQQQQQQQPIQNLKYEAVENQSTHDNESVLAVNTDEPVMKRRRIRMNVNDCLEHSQSADGAKPLSNPFQASSKSGDPNMGLYPRMPNRRYAKLLPSEQGQGHCGFVSARQLTGAINLPSANVIMLGSTPPKHKTATKSAPSPEKQTSIVNYLKTAKPERKAVKCEPLDDRVVTPIRSQYGMMETDDIYIPSTPEKSPQVSQSSGPRTPSKMFSPVKQVQGSAIYVIDSSPEMDRTFSSQTQRLINHTSTVKKLFDASNSKAASSPAKRGRKPTKGKVAQNQKRLRANEAVKKGSNFTRLSLQDDDCHSINSHDSFDLASVDWDDSLDMYGLLGSGKYPCETKPEINHFEKLPVEILENVFCLLPILDLCLNSNRVCRAWNDVISNPKYLFWKKLYSQLKKEVEGVHEMVKAMMLEHGMIEKNNFLVNLIRYMKTYKPVTSGNMNECLAKHTKYSWAKELMEERFPDSVCNGFPNPWCVVTVLVIISETVGDISEILQVLLSPQSQCSIMEVQESLYCVAMFLLAFKLVLSKEVWNGMHYRLYYALYLFENASSISCAQLQDTLKGITGQQNILKYNRGDATVRLTHEQLRICSHHVNRGETIKIVAFAGTGKTTTLLRYTQLRPQMRFLLVIYNKSVREHSNKIFPPNVTCKTGHGLAYGHTGYRYKHKFGYINVQDATQIIPPRKGENLYVRAKHVLDTLQCFFVSADPFITTAHTPSEKMDKNGLNIPIAHHMRMAYVEDAEFVWSRMKDHKNTNVKMTHDGYLKLYQLENPRIRDFDCILIDEAQDLTPALSSVLMSQSQTKLLVGDPHQQIYSFRGAVNAMQQVTATRIFYLTQSFRFGPEIARVAASCLELLKNEKQKTLVGNGTPGLITGVVDGQLAIITRTNFQLFNEAVKKCCYSQADRDCKVHFIGGTKGFGFDKIQEIYALLLSPEQRQEEGRIITNKHYLKCGNLPNLERYANETCDVELAGKIRIVKTYHHNLPVVIKSILKKHVSDERHADILFSTAHKSKGLEFDTVKVSDDFYVSPVFVQNMAALNIPGNTNRDASGDESNLLYVAVTRAKKALLMSATLQKMLTIAGERFEYPVSSKFLQSKGVAMKCLQTNAEFQPLALALQKKELKLGDGALIAGGVLSPDAVALDKASLAGLLGPLETQRPEHYTVGK